MTNLWSKYLLPAALAGLVLAETAGSGTLYRRESPDLLRRIDIAALQVDTLQRLWEQCYLPKEYMTFRDKASCSVKLLMIVHQWRN